MKLFSVVEEPIDVSQYEKLVLNEHQGAVVTFTGHVREWTHGTKTVHLEYEAYTPMAEKMMVQIGAEIEERWPGVITAMAHRVGHLNISDIAVVIVTSSPHRKNAYAANEYAIERIKEIVPIWKKEVWEDGEEWVGDTKQYHPNVEEEQ